MLWTNCQKAMEHYHARWSAPSKSWRHTCPLADSLTKQYHYMLRSHTQSYPRMHILLPNTPPRLSTIYSSYATSPRRELRNCDQREAVAPQFFQLPRDNALLPVRQANVDMSHLSPDPSPTTLATESTLQGLPADEDGP